MITSSRYDSRYNSEYKERIQEAVEYILEQPYGSTIPTEKLAYILKYNIESETELKKFKAQMGKIRNFLVDYGYILKSVPGVGYYILKPKQISGYCYRAYITRTQRLLDKSNRVLEHVDQTELSDTRKEELSNIVQLNTALTDVTWKTIQASGYYKRKAYYDSLEDENIDKHIPHVD